MAGVSFVKMYGMFETHGKCVFLIPRYMASVYLKKAWNATIGNKQWKLKSNGIKIK